MCVFSGPVRSVAGTKLFARGASGGRQILVYAMSVAADADLAMILPLPVPPGPPEDAVRFLDLRGYPHFFGAIEAAWPVEEMTAKAESVIIAGKMAPKLLPVHDVGDFEASFVPTLADFDRIDPRFRLPHAVWAALPGYADYGFAVSKLRGGAAARGRARAIHPMALEFPVRDPSLLFFPTVHVHDGAVHPNATFDHVLYFQGYVLDHKQAFARPGIGRGYDTSPQKARDVVDLKRAAGIFDADAPFRRMVMQGRFPNRDTVVELLPSPTA